MIKGSTKVGEVFICGLDSDGTLEVLPQYLGKAITGLGGGCDQMFVIEEDEGFLGVVSALQPRAAGNQYREGDIIGTDTGKEPPFRNNTHDGNRPSGRKHQALAHQKFGMTPFDQQQQQQNQGANGNPNANIQNNPLALVDQKIEERESLRHSTHRSQRSERLSQQQQQQAQKGAGGNFHQTTSDRFDNTEYSDNGNTGMAAQAQAHNNQFLQQNGYATSMTNQQQIQEENKEGDAQNLTQDMGQQNAAQQNTTGQDTSEDPNHQTGGNSTWQQQQAQRNTSTHLKRGLSNTQQHENMGRLQQIRCGKDHTLNLTRDGDVFSHGVGTFCAAGHGGSRAAEKPQILKPLRDKRVTQIACGESHSLVLTDKGYLYAWGRGFEGQLGISSTIEVAATPSFVKYFHKKAVASVAAGSFHSIAITEDGDLYTWGEGKMGQLGVGCVRQKRMPEQVHFDFEDEEKSQEGEHTRLHACSAGFGHTAALSQEGHLYMWGFNVYGQLGVGDKKTRWQPERIVYDSEGQELPLCAKVACSKYATYAIDQLGRPYSWGKGYTGHAGLTMHDLPRRICTNTQNRIFTDVFANSDSALLYSPIRVFQIEPKCGPSRGGTVIRIVGTGFVESSKLRVRFTYGALSREVACSFDFESRSLICRTPVFAEFEGENLQMPCDCFLSVTMDGINYSECEEPFKIYSNEIFLTTINPKCGSVAGGTQLTLGINIDEVTASSLETLKIGFQAKRQATPSGAGAPANNNPGSLRGSQESRLQGAGSPTLGGADEFSQGEWICTEGIYANGIVTATVPHLESFKAENMSYCVDVALNGQQFTGRPVSFRYYDIQIERVEPSFGPHEGGTNVVICGRGLYDASIKRIQFATDCSEGMREVTADWDRKDRAIRCTVPPLGWMFNGGEGGEPGAEEEKVEQADGEDQEEVKSDKGPSDEEARQRVIAEKPIRIRITFNNQEWIDALSFKYHDATLTKIAHAHAYTGPLDANVTQEERDAAWLAEEPEEPQVEEQTQPLTEDERKKRDEERKKQDEEKMKQLAAEKEEVTTIAKRKGFKCFLHGTGFLQRDNLLSVRFSYNGGEVERDVVPVFKNSKLLGLSLPDMGEGVPIGPHMLTVEITLNGQQYTANSISVMFNQVDPNLTDEDLRKMDEDEAKNQKKKPGKK